MLRGEEVKSGMTARPTCLSGKLTHALDVDMDMAANFFQHPVRPDFLVRIRRIARALSQVSRYLDTGFNEPDRPCLSHISSRCHDQAVNTPQGFCQARQTDN